jgi:hypothetical protein
MAPRRFLLVLILLVGLALRLAALTAVPPGLTHDEANHGREAIGILDGDLRYFFPLNYGSEPLYSYAVAGIMAAIGETVFALRLVNVGFGLLAIAATYAWASAALNWRTGATAAALMAVSFWPLASSREALRAGMLPFFMTVAVWLFWRLVFGLRGNGERAGPAAQAWLIAGFALAIVATFHIYLAARVVWLLFPVFLAYLFLWHRAIYYRRWRPVMVALLLAAAMLIPMAVYLRAHPEAQTRLSMLGNTLAQLRAGDLAPLVGNAGRALLAFVLSGYGDRFLAYNIPGRPLFDTISAIFFVTGVVICLSRWRRPAYAFVLLWFLFAIMPSLLTGPTANTTRNVAAMPAVFILPAIGFIAAAAWLGRLAPVYGYRWAAVLALAWLLFAGWTSGRDYFQKWAGSPAVRGAYQQNLIAVLEYWRAASIPSGETVLSSVYPGAAHDPSIALVTIGEESEGMRWVDARQALLLPAGGGGTALIPASTPPHPAFAGLLSPIESVALRSADLDPSFTAFRIDPAELSDRLSGAPIAEFGNGLQLLAADWLEQTVDPGGTAQLMTTWSVEDASALGPLHPPVYQPDLVLFTHVLDDADQIVAQHDSLEAPAWAWQKGDILMQVHPITVPLDVTPGVYRATLGVYDRVSGVRIPPTSSPETEVFAPDLEVVRSGKSEDNGT